MSKVESVIMAGMIFPKQVPGFKWLTILTAIYGIVWMSLEGDLRRVIVMGTAVSLSLVGYGLGRFLGGRSFHVGSWLTVTAVGGLVAGISSGLLTIFFMALKTGIHGHGPEFRPSEIERVVGMIPLWGVVGLLAGLGIGVLVWGVRKPDF
jgi:hypothetical protein